MTDHSEMRAHFLQGRAGDQKAHHAFLSEAARLLRAYFRKRMPNSADAEDLVQDVLLALHARRDTYDLNYPLTAWMFAIAKHRHFDFLRRHRRRRETSWDGLECAAADPAFDACDARRDLASFMARLPEKQQTVLRLVKLEQRHVREVAAATHLTESDIKVSTHRALKSMQKWARQSALSA